MRHVIALGVELWRPVHSILQDAQKLRRNLFPLGHCRFDGGTFELSGGSFELMQDPGYVH